MSNATNKTVSVECGKCEGKGNLWFWGHRDNGVCYQCKGTGKVSGQSMTARQQARLQASCDLDSLAECGDRVLTVNPSYAKHMVRRAAQNMLAAADTQWARSMLAGLPVGIRAAVIAAGFELKAA